MEGEEKTSFLQIQFFGKIHTSIGWNFPDNPHHTHKHEDCECMLFLNKPQNSLN